MSDTTKKQDGWISVDDRLPEIAPPSVFGSDCVLGFSDGEVDMVFYVALPKNARWRNCYDQIVGVTHWMPLPQPPQQEGGQ